MDDNSAKAQQESSAKILIHQNIGMLNTTRRTLEGAHRRLMQECVTYEHSPAYLKMQIALSDLSTTLKRLESAEDEISLLHNYSLQAGKIIPVDKL